MAKKPSNGDKPAAAPLPPELRAALPTAGKIAAASAQIAALIPILTEEMRTARRNGATNLARSFVVFKRMMERLEKDLEPLGAMFKAYKEELVPETLDFEGVTNVPLAEGFRVGTSLVFRASIKPGKKDEAYAWLREQKHGDIIVEQINSSTLSSVAGELLKDHCLELPDELFNVHIASNTSVTSTK